MADPGSEMEKIGTVIARSLAYLCLKNSDANEGTVLEKAQFLSALGLAYPDAAKMLGSTAESLRVMAYNQGKGKKSGNEAKGKAKTKRGKRTR